MKLSAEHFAELAASFQGRETTKHDQRRASRLEIRAKVKIIPVISGQWLDPVEVLVCDFSARGISFLFSSDMEHGRQFVTELPRKAGGSVLILCTVMHARSVGTNTFRVGAEFTCPAHPPAKAQPADDSREMQRIRESMLS